MSSILKVDTLQDVNGNAIISSDGSGNISIPNLTTTGNINFGDNDKAQFGTGNDIQLYHDGSNSYFDGGDVGAFYIRGGTSGQGDLNLTDSAGGNRFLTGTEGGATAIYHNASNAKKLETTSTGIDVTGTVVSDGLTVAGNVSVDGGTIKLDGNYPVGTGNVALGNTALDSNASDGNYNTAIGNESLTGNTTGDGNTAIGHIALRDNTTGLFNTALGAGSLTSNSTGSYNTSIGYTALVNNTDSGNTAVGYEALTANTSGSFNSSLGRDSLKANTTGITNTGIGHSALSANTTASKNTGLGYGGLFVNTTGANNTSVGAYSMYSNLTGSNNVAVGTDALYNNTASDNTAVGYEAGKLTTTGGSNTFVGRGSGNAISTGSSNTIIGRYTGNQGGLDLRVASNNVVLSDGAGNIRYYHTGVNTLIGTFNNSPAESATEDGIRLGDNGGCQFSANGLEVMRINRNTNDGRIIGLCGQTTVRGEIAVSGTIIQYTSFSDHRLKEDVQQISNATESLKQLNPVNFAWIDGGVRMNGFLAHEVQSVVPEAVTGTHNEVDSDDNPVYQGIDQSKLVPLLVATIKELEARITALEGA
jgi:hypothetical protein